MVLICGFAVLGLFQSAGCGPTRVRVLDDLTGQPVARATVTPYVCNFFGTPCKFPSVVTDADGRAAVPYRHNLHGFHVSHPNLREVCPVDRPRSDGKEELLYLRRPPRVVLLVPDGFVGPVLVDPDDGAQAREPTYRIAVPPDPLQPVGVPGLLYTGLVRLDEIEAERDGVVVPPARAADPGAVAVWVAKPSGMFYKFYEADHYVSVLFVGTSDGFEAFQRGLHERLSRQGLAKKLDWIAIAEVWESALSASAAKE